MADRSLKDLAAGACDSIYFSGKGAGLAELYQLAAMDDSVHPIVARARIALKLMEDHVMFEDTKHHEALAALAYDPSEF